MIRDNMEERAPSVFGSDDEMSTGEEVSVTGSVKDRKRKRSSQKISCELCKTRKVKCDRAEPACTWCARHNRECVYKERQKPGIRVGYGLELEAKINRLDALLQVLGRRVEDHILNHDERPPSLSLSPGQSQPSTHVPAYTSSIDPLTVDTPSQKGPFADPVWASVDGREGSRTAEFPTSDRTSVQSLINLPVPDALSQANRPASANSNFQDQTALTSDPDLPPHDILYTLVDLYFKHVNTWCPILDRKNTFGTFFGSTSLSESDRVLLHAIVATTLRFSKDPRLSPEVKKRYHQVSKLKVEIYGMNYVSVEALKALVILALDVLGTSNGPIGWNLLALIARNIVQLDLCVESNVYLSTSGTPATGSLRRVALAQPQSWIEDEGRRRLCWMVYILDRYATIATTFNFMLDDKQMDRSLPCRYDLFSKNVPVETRSFNWADRNRRGVTLNKPENLGSFSYHCEVLRILSRVHEFLKKPIDIGSVSDVQGWRTTYRSLDAELNSWLNGLPGEYGKISQLCHSDPASRVANWIMLHAAFVTSVIRLHSSAAYPTVRSHIFMPSYFAMQRCLSAVESLRDIAQDVLETNGLDLLGPPFAFSLWVSARLLLVHAATMECEVDPKVHFFISTLNHMGQFWEVAANYAKILSRIVQEGQTGERTYTSMRRCAFELVSLTSSRRQTVLEPTTTRTTTLKELEYIDVFDFFNFPRLISTPTPITPGGSDSMLNDPKTRDMTDIPAMSFATPNPDSDWLHFEPPYE